MIKYVMSIDLLHFDGFLKSNKKNNLKIIDISFNEINGGSAEIICAKQDSTLKSKNKINSILNDEKKLICNLLKTSKKEFIEQK